jgi:DNA polymerase III subunit epsilon
VLREIVLDTETTGTDPQNGDRIVELGCVELVNHIPTGRHFHRYLNPERAMSQGAFAVHGLSDAFLSDKPRFAEVADEFLAFVGEARLVIHNAAFDMGFLNAELKRLARPALGAERAVDTLLLARRRHPGAPNSLDALCARYGIDNSRRTKHGALLDAEILAEVYIELLGGKQADLGLTVAAGHDRSRPVVGSVVVSRSPRPAPRPLSERERQAHLALVASLGPSALWRAYGWAPDEAP